MIRLATFLALGWLAACAQAPIPSATDPIAPQSSDIGAITVTGDAIEDAQALGRARAALGDATGAERAFRAGVAAAEGRFGVDSPRVAGPVLQLALVVSQQRRVIEADSLFARAERLMARPADPWDPPRLDSYRAIHAANLGNLTAARDLARRASLKRRDLLQVESGSGAGFADLAPGLAELAHGLLVESAIALRLNQLDGADLSANLARRVLAELPGAPAWWIAEADEIIGLIDAEKRSFGSARERLDVAFQTKLGAFGQRRPVGLTLLSLGRVRLREGERTAAVENMRSGLEVIRAGGAVDTTLGFGRLNDYLTALSLAEDNRSAATGEMFWASQLLAGGVAARTITLTVARIAAGREDGGDQIAALQAAAYRRDALRLALGRESAKPAAFRDADAIDVLRAQTIAATEEAERLSQRLGAGEPRLAALLDPAPLTGAEIGQLLGPDEALLSYAVGPEGAWGFLVRASGVRAAKLATDAGQLETAVQSLRRAFTVGPTGSAGAFDLALAHDLYRQLIGPLADGLDGVRHLIVVPDGALQSLPIATLVAAPPSAAGIEGYRTAEWLGRRHAISTMPSVRAFADLRRFARPSAAPRALFGMANPVLLGTADRAGAANLETLCRDDRPIAPDLLRAMAPLPDTADELRRVAASVGGSGDTLILGADATEGRLRANALDQYRVLYFATHGLLPHELVCQSEPALVLTPPASAVTDTNADGLLTASEIAGLKLDADLVVLSACNTASANGGLAGDALSGLSRAFFHAGARALMVTHWQVESRAAAELMTRTFQAVSARGSRGLADALQAAQSQLSSQPETAHPFFWAPFTLIGDGRRAVGATG